MLWRHSTRLYSENLTRLETSNTLVNEVLCLSPIALDLVLRIDSIGTLNALANEVSCLGAMTFDCVLRISFDWEHRINSSTKFRALAPLYSTVFWEFDLIGTLNALSNEVSCLLYSTVFWELTRLEYWVYPSTKFCALAALHSTVF